MTHSYNYIHASAATYGVMFPIGLINAAAYNSTTGSGAVRSRT